MGRDGWIVLHVVVDRKQCVKKDLDGYGHHSLSPVASFLDRPRLPVFHPRSTQEPVSFITGTPNTPFDSCFCSMPRWLWKGSQDILVCIGGSRDRKTAAWVGVLSVCVCWGGVFSSEIPVVRVTPAVWTDQLTLLIGGWACNNSTGAHTLSPSLESLLGKIYYLRQDLTVEFWLDSSSRSSNRLSSPRLS